MAVYNTFTAVKLDTWSRSIKPTTFIWHIKTNSSASAEKKACAESASHMILMILVSASHLVLDKVLSANPQNVADMAFLALIMESLTSWALLTLLQRQVATMWQAETDIFVESIL